MRSETDRRVVRNPGTAQERCGAHERRQRVFVTTTSWVATV
ncbi:hypothetical protein RMSM_00617 [Rhodopirellula maiorica SM1]|uniref:Uncharacterized protein n=1 Tax=Rhodopirellula maiorica SM1 TaxID=1265738 RepID=M5RTD2_9BACT|nr:hypothetical protein RMSM_00617 [Rhodopirellula maiorica SM1]